MAYITFYDITETDKNQIEQVFSATDHHCEYITERISPENLHPETEVLSVFVTSTVTREIIEQLPKLKLISCRSTGFNTIDLAAAKEHGVTVCNVPTYGENTVAEYAFTLILALSRKLRQAMHEVAEAQVDQALLHGFDLAGKTMGVLGMGHIGIHTAQIAKGFGMEIVAFDPFPNEDRAKEFGFRYVTLDELAAQSDVISLHAPATKENTHIVDAAFLEKMKPTALLINTARGELVDTAALIDALHESKIAGAGLDTVEGEGFLDVDESVALLRQKAPANTMANLMNVNVLRQLPNVIITPHNAFNTFEAIGRINTTAAENIVHFLEGNTTNEVKPPEATYGKLILVRHGESEWNVLGKWTGTTDVHLTEKGFREAALLGQALEDVPMGYAYCSQQIRALETLEGILDASRQFDVQFERSDTLNERDYGDYTGLNKWEMRDKVGDEEFNAIRRNWDHPVPNGETLKMVYERAVPFYKEHILPKLLEGTNILVVSHGNAIRALTKYIEDITDEGIAEVEMPFGKVVIYDVLQDGKMKQKEERKIDTTPPHA